MDTESDRQARLLAEAREQSAKAQKMMDQYLAQQRPSPDKLYVDVPTIAKSASRLVFLVCLFALFVWVMTGFAMVHPIIAAMTMIGSVGFYIMGSMAENLKS